MWVFSRIGFVDFTVMVLTSVNHLGDILSLEGRHLHPPHPPHTPVFDSAWMLYWTATVSLVSKTTTKPNTFTKEIKDVINLEEISHLVC